MQLVVAKIVQAEGCAKFIWTQPRRRLSSEKIVQAIYGVKFIWLQPRYGLFSVNIVFFVSGSAGNYELGILSGLKYRYMGRQFSGARTEAKAGGLRP